MILVNNPGSWSHIYPPLEHAPWHGLTPTDLVFPFFLFAVGNALSFVMPKLEAGGDGLFWKKVIKRSLLIYLIGLFLTWWPFVQWDKENQHLLLKQWINPSDHTLGIRTLGVLARIAICYFLASVIIYYGKTRIAFIAGIIILLLYWALCFFLGDKTDPYSMTGWFGNTIDRKILGIPHIYKGEGIPFDPEGLMSAIPAIVQVILGYIAGNYIRQKVQLSASTASAASAKPLAGLFVVGVVFMLAGYSWDILFPINKKIWTSSYVIYTTGLAMIIIGTMIYLIEFRKLKGWLSRFFDVFGKNALFVFALSSFIPKTLWLIRIKDGTDRFGDPTYTDPWHAFYKYVCAKIPGDPRLGSLAFALFVITLMWAICWWMDKKKIYVKV